MTDKYKAIINIDSDAGEKIKFLAKQNYITPTAFIRIIILKYLDVHFDNNSYFNNLSTTIQQDNNYLNKKHIKEFLL